MPIQRWIRILAPIVVLAGFAYIAWSISQNTPSLTKAVTKPPRLSVQTTHVRPVDFVVEIASYGRVRPRTRSNLVAQVSGQIIGISEHFRNGGFVEKDDVLVRVDPVDYQVQIDITQGEVAEAELALEEEKARGKQARKDWLKIGGLATASDLALRVPQLRAAQARLATARARLKQARVNLGRTLIKAPFAGRLLNTNVDIGTVVSPQSVLGELYASDYVEVRLPLKNADLAYIQLPEGFVREQQGQRHAPMVVFTNNLTSPAQLWSGTVVRTEGAIDETTQQLYVVAQIDDPFGLKSAQETAQPSGEQLYPLKIGQYLPARIKGRTIENALVIPTSVIYQGRFVYLVRDDVLFRQDIEVGFQSQHQALVLNGLQAHDELVLTALGQVASGTPITRLTNASADQETVGSAELPLSDAGGNPIVSAERETNSSSSELSARQAEEAP